MDTFEKFKLLTKYALFEKEDIPAPFMECVRDVCTPKGKMKVLKILQTTYCDKNCLYCMFRRDREETERVFISPEELARVFMLLYERGMVKGLFISSGVYKHPEFVSEKMIDTVIILRKRYGYKGYIHTKIMPGVSLQTVEEAVKWSNRVSVNLEAPNEKRLKAIARGKSILNDMLEKIEKISKLLENHRGKDQITQIMVGTSDETDLELLKSAHYLYKKYRIKRVYYSAFFPVKGTPLENKPPAPKEREYRLYQADFLIKRYGFRPEDFEFKEGFLPLDKDPKELWAERNIHLFPVDINRADYEMLIRIPGIGPVSAKRILEFRKNKKITSIEELKSLGCNTKKAVKYIKLPQRSLFETLV